MLSTTSFETLNEHVLLVLDGDEFEISIMEMKPDFSPLLSTIKHSLDTIGIQTLDEESCSEFAASDEVTAAGTKITDIDGDHCATDITLTQQQKADTDSDFSLILYQGYTGPTNNLDHTDTSSKIACLFPETKETRDEGATDSDSNTDVSAHSVTRVGLVKNSITGQVKGTRLINKAINSCNSFSDFIRDLAEPQEVVEMELQEKKGKSLDELEDLALNIHTEKGRRGRKTGMLWLLMTYQILFLTHSETHLKKKTAHPVLLSHLLINMKILPLIMHPWIQRPVIHRLIYQPF